MEALTREAPVFMQAFSALFPVVGPISTALLISPFFSKFTAAERKASALKIVSYSFGLGLGTILLGSWVLKLMGVSASTTQMAGGVIIAAMGLKLLNSGAAESENEKTASDAGQNSLFYPFAFPLTIGPGAISVLITLTATARDLSFLPTVRHLAYVTIAMTVVLVIAYFCYAYESFFIQRIGKTGAEVLNRLMSFFVFCVGIQMLLKGFSAAYPNILPEAL